jgi:hypothetical protein
MSVIYCPTCNWPIAGGRCACTEQKRIKKQMIKNSLGETKQSKYYDDLCLDCDPIKFPLCDKCLGC